MSGETGDRARQSVEASQTDVSLRLAVVGHTNAGKTSLLRTLARDAGFGEVSASPATTRDVRGVALVAEGRTVAEFVDTPGLEDSIGLLEYVDGLRTDRREDGATLVERFLESDAAEGRFAQESKAIRAARTADVVLYVVDARERVLPRHRDEIELLSRCGRPMVPVLNFVADDAARTEEWRDALGRLGLHASAAFDTVALDFESERRLFEALRTMAPDHGDALRALIADRAHRRDRARTLAARATADLLVDIAALMIPVESADRDDDGARARVESDATERLRGAVRARERRAITDVLAAWEFDERDAIAEALELTAGRLGIDLFSPEALKTTGKALAAGAAGGAATGAAIDLAVGGITLGAAAAIGALVGGVLSSGLVQGKRLARLARGGNELRAGDTALRLLLLRQLDLARALERRGHASVDAFQLKGVRELRAFGKDVDRILKSLRPVADRPNWCLIDRASPPPPARDAFIDDLATSIERLATLTNDDAVADDRTTRVTPS